MLLPAEAVLRGMDPFIAPYGAQYVPYPLTAALLGIPFTVLSPHLRASLLTGIATAWLAYLVTARGTLWSLLIFCSLPFVDAVMCAQFSPLLMALALAGCAPLAVLIKPQVALPLLLTYRSRRGAFVVAGVVLCGSLVLMPSWPWAWLSRLKGYEGAVWILSWPGALVLLAGLCWEQPAARLLILIACFPQRSMYDALALWLVPQTRSGMLALTLLSWAVNITLGLLGAGQMTSPASASKVRLMELPTPRARGVVVGTSCGSTGARPLVRGRRDRLAACRTWQAAATNGSGP